MTAIKWELSEKQAYYIMDKTKYLLVEGSAWQWENDFCLL